MKAPGAKKLTLLMDTDRDIYGGHTQGLDHDAVEWVEGSRDVVTVTLPPFSGRCYIVE